MDNTCVGETDYRPVAGRPCHTMAGEVQTSGRCCGQCRSEDKVHQSVVRMYDGKKKNGFSSSKTSLVEAEELLLELVQAFPKVYIVLDALDKCPKKDRSKLIDIFNRLVSALPNAQLKILVSSRRNDDITKQLRKEANIAVAATDNKHGIRKFVIDKIHRHGQRGERLDMPMIPDDLRGDIASVFMGKSRGMFQWAALHIAQLLDLQRVSDIRLSLGRFPEGLEKAYDTILASIRNQKGSKAEVGLRALQWVYAAETIMQIELLVEAVCQNPIEDSINIIDIDATYVIGACQILVVLDTDGYCRFSHLSVEEYLVFYLQQCINSVHEWFQLGCTDSILTWNCSHYDDELVRMVIARGCDVNQLSPGGQNALIATATASPRTNSKVFDMLLEAGADPDAGGEPGSALQFIAKMGQTKLVQRLLEFGTNVNVRTKNKLGPSCVDCPYGSALAAAAAEGHTDTMLLLLDCGADVNLLLDGLYGSALAAAPYHGQAGIVLELLRRGASLKSPVPGPYGSALAAAVQSYRCDEGHTIKLLIETGVDVDMLTGGYHGSALAVASRLGFVSTMRILLERGAKITMPLRGEYRSALAAAACYREGIEPLRHLLISIAVTCNPLTDIGIPIAHALEVAASKGNATTIQYLCRWQASVNMKTPEYGSALCAAAANGKLDALELLCHNGADVNLNINGFNALAAAAIQGREKAMQLLIGKGADVHAELKGMLRNALEAVYHSDYIDPEERQRMVRLLEKSGAVWPRDNYFSDVSSWFTEIP